MKLPKFVATKPPRNKRGPIYAMVHLIRFRKFVGIAHNKDGWMQSVSDSVKNLQLQEWHAHVKCTATKAHA